MAELKIRYATTNKNLKEHNEKFLKLGKMMEFHRQNSINHKDKLTHLEAKLTATQVEVVHLSPQPVAARSVHDEAWALGFSYGLKRLRRHL